MAATATPAQIFSKLLSDFERYAFIKGDGFAWSANKLQITYSAASSADDIWSILHEIAHAELAHTSYLLDIELLKQEVAAWEFAKAHLAPTYGNVIADEFIQEHLDTYRQWLHRRSLCPDCQQNGFQVSQNTYSCSNCRCLWRVNDARLCGLQRIKLPNRSLFEKLHC